MVWTHVWYILNLQYSEEGVILIIYLSKICFFEYFTKHYIRLYNTTSSIFTTVDNLIFTL